MEGLVFVVLVGGLSLALTWVRGSVLPRRALGRAQEGRRVTLRGRLQVLPAPLGVPPAGATGRARSRRPEPAVLERLGDELHVSTPRRHWVLPVRELQAAAGRTWVDLREAEERWSLRLAGPAGEHGTLTVTARWRPVVAALAAAPAAPVGSAAWTVATPGTGAATAQPSVALLRSVVPRWAAWTGALSAVFLAAWLFLLLRATVRVSPVVGVDRENSACWVEWVEAGRSFRGAPTCDPDAMPALGERMTYLTTPWPVPGSAWDTELPWVMATLLGLVVAVAVTRVGVALVSARSRTPEAVTVSVPSAGTSRSSAGASVEELDLVGLIDLVSADLGWADVPEKHPGDSRQSWRLDARRAWRQAPRWPLFVAVGASVVALSEDRPTTLAWAAGVVGALSVLGVLWRAWSTFAVLRPTWGEPFTSEWTFRSVEDATGQWILLLLLGRTAHWSVPVQARPPLQGTCLVRGELRDGGSIHVRIGADLWLPAGAVLPCDDEVREVLWRDLCFQLTGDPEADVDRIRRAAHGPTPSP